MIVHQLFQSPPANKTGSDYIDPHIPCAARNNRSIRSYKYNKPVRTTAAVPAKYCSHAMGNASESLALSRATHKTLTAQEGACDWHVQQLHPYDSPPHNPSTQHAGTPPYHALDSNHPQRANQRSSTGSSYASQVHPQHRSNSTALPCNSRTG